MASRDRKTAIVGGIVVVSLLVIGRGVPAWNRWRIENEESARVVLAQAFEVALSVNRAREIDAIHRRSGVQKIEVKPAFVSGSEISTGAANLAAIVVDVANGNGVRMGSLQTSADSATLQDGNVAHVRVRGEATGDVSGVTKFLASLESGLPLIAVRELSIAQGDPISPPDRPESLRVGFVIEALVHIDQPVPSK
jgi:hypothetical protein